MRKRMLQIVVTFTGAVAMALSVCCVDWWLYILTGKTLCKGLMNFIDNTKLRDYTL
jgi:hypothetical protein